ncbi:MAG: hypothetical protein IKZ26_02100 [Peptococcaceae bacterium]|nr:hypothetical protein [Peptococcaceae bacterium]
MGNMIIRAFRGSMPIALGIAAVNVVMMLVMGEPAGSEYFNSMVSGALAGGWIGGFAFCMIMEVMKMRAYKAQMQQNASKKSGGKKKKK